MPSVCVRCWCLAVCVYWIVGVCVLADAAEPLSLQQQRSSVLQLCSQLQRASLLAQQQQQQQSSAGGWTDDSLSSSARSISGAGSNTARTVLSLLQSNRKTLDYLPKVWLPLLRLLICRPGQESL